MSRKRYHPFIAEVFKKVAPKIGATVYLEPSWGIVGQLTFKNGQKRYFRGNTIDLNYLGASEVAKDKDYANFFLKKMGYPTVPGRAFYSDAWSAMLHSTMNIDAGYRYAKRLGFPLVVKPNSGSQGVNMRVVWSKQEFYRAMRAIFAEDPIALVQRKVEGRDYRIVVLDKDVISAYERIPLSVTGDGHSTILTLLKRKQRAFKVAGRDTRLQLDDPRITDKLARQKLSLRSTLKRGERVFILDNANLSTGGDPVDVTRQVHPAFKKLAVSITRDMGLRFCGVDLMVDGDIAGKPGRYVVLEINSAPGLDHYVKTGKSQQKLVEKLYLRVLKSMSR